MIGEYMVEVNEKHHELQNSNQTKSGGNEIIGVSSSKLAEDSVEE